MKKIFGSILVLFIVTQFSGVYASAFTNPVPDDWDNQIAGYNIKTTWTNGAYSPMFDCDIYENGNEGFIVNLLGGITNTNIYIKVQKRVDGTASYTIATNTFKDDLTSSLVQFAELDSDSGQPIDAIISCDNPDGNDCVESIYEYRVYVDENHLVYNIDGYLWVWFEDLE